MPKNKCQSSNLLFDTEEVLKRFFYQENVGIGYLDSKYNIKCGANDLMHQRKYLHFAKMHALSLAMKDINYYLCF